MFGEQDVEDGEGLLSQTSTQEGIISTSSRASSGIERIDSLHFVAGCRKRRLNQALSFLPLSLVFFEYVCFAIILTRDTFSVVLCPKSEIKCTSSANSL